MLVESGTVGITTKYAVVGAGPAGLAATATILQDNSSASIIWIDESFMGGRLSKFPNVPSNTRASLFVQFATACHPKGETLPTVTEKIKTVNEDAGCRLEWAWDMVVDLTRLLQSSYQDCLTLVKGRCLKLEEISEGGWKLTVSGEDANRPTSYQVDKVILATGCHPKAGPALPQFQGETLDPEIFLCPQQLSTQVQSNDVLGVVGNSHTAILILRNLIQFTHPTVRIINFYRSPLRFAEHLPDGRIKHDNTGLKGEAAEWARQELLPHDSQNPMPSYLFEGKLVRLAMPDKLAEGQIYTEWLPQCTKLIWAIGYERNQLPDLVNNAGSPVMVESHDSQGRLCDDQGNTLNGLFGIGIAFPECVIDVGGDEGGAVGLWKFIKTAKGIFGDTR